MGSSGSDGTVWGVDSTNTAFRYVGDGFIQTEPSAQLSAVAVGTAGNVWGLDPAGNVWILSASSLQPSAMPGAAELSIGGDGATWGVDSSGHALQLVSGGWQQRGSLTQVAVGNATTVWGLAGAQAMCWDTQASAFLPVSAPPLQAIAVSPDALFVWAQTTDGRTLRFAGGGNWTTVASGTPNLIALAAGANGLLYGYENPSQYGVYRFGGSSWSPLGYFSPVTGLGFSPDGTLTMISDEIACRRNGYTTWEKIYNQSQVLEFVPANSHLIYWEQFNGMAFSQWDGSYWMQAPGSLADLSVGADGATWGVDATNHVFQYTNNPSPWQSRPGSLQRISAGTSSHIVGLDASGKIVAWTGSGWTQVPSPPTPFSLRDVAVGADGTLAAVASDHSAWAQPPSASWRQIPNLALTQIDVGTRYSLCGATTISAGQNQIWQGSV